MRLERKTNIIARLCDRVVSGRKTRTLRNGLLITIIMHLCAAADNTGSSDYMTVYACEGTTLHIQCAAEQHIQLIRANFGRFSITICNEMGNTDWSVNCMSPRTLPALQNSCGVGRTCSVQVDSLRFGDPCNETFKYIEVQYRCKKVVLSDVVITERLPPMPWFTSYLDSESWRPHSTVQHREHSQKHPHEIQQPSSRFIDNLDRPSHLDGSQHEDKQRVSDLNTEEEYVYQYEDDERDGVRPDDRSHRRIVYSDSANGDSVHRELPMVEETENEKPTRLSAQSADAIDQIVESLPFDKSLQFEDQTVIASNRWILDETRRRKVAETSRQSGVSASNLDDSPTSHTWDSPSMANGGHPFAGENSDYKASLENHHSHDNRDEIDHEGLQHHQRRQHQQQSKDLSRQSNKEQDNDDGVQKYGIAADDIVAVEADSRSHNSTHSILDTELAEKVNDMSQHAYDNSEQSVGKQADYGIHTDRTTRTPLNMTFNTESKCEARRSRGDLLWNATVAGHTMRQSCPPETVGTAVWHCRAAAVWEDEQPDLSGCTHHLLARLLQTTTSVNKSAHVSTLHVAAQLARTVRSGRHQLYGGDLLAAIEISRQLVVRQQSRLLSGVMTPDVKQVRETTAAELVSSAVRQISDLITAEQLPAWRDLTSGKSGSQAVALVWTTLEQAARLLVDSIGSDRTVVEVAAHVVMTVHHRQLREQPHLLFPCSVPSRSDHWLSAGDCSVTLTSSSLSSVDEASSEGSSHDSDDGLWVRLAFIVINKSSAMFHVLQSELTSSVFSIHPNTEHDDVASPLNENSLADDEPVLRMDTYFSVEHASIVCIISHAVSVLLLDNKYQTRTESGSNFEPRIFDSPVRIVLRHDSDCVHDADIDQHSKTGIESDKGGRNGRRCAIWQQWQRRWMFDACQARAISTTHTQCTCSRPGIVVVVADHRQPPSIGDLPPLSRSSSHVPLSVYVGSVLAIVCLSVVAVSLTRRTTEVAVCCRRDSVPSQTVPGSLQLLNMAASFAATELFLLLGLHHHQLSPSLQLQSAHLPSSLMTPRPLSTPSAVCSLFAGLTQMALLSALCWQLLFMYGIYVNLASSPLINALSGSMAVGSVSGSDALRQVSIGYGVPFLIVLVSSVVAADGYGSAHHCCLSTEHYFVLSLLAPACFALLATMVLLLLSWLSWWKHRQNLLDSAVLDSTKTVPMIAKFRSSAPSCSSTTTTTLAKVADTSIRQPHSGGQIATAAILFCLVSTTWPCGMLYVYSRTITVGNLYGLFSVVLALFSVALRITIGRKPSVGWCGNGQADGEHIDEQLAAYSTSCGDSRWTEAMQRSPAPPIDSLCPTKLSTHFPAVTTMKVKAAPAIHLVPTSDISTNTAVARYENFAPNFHDRLVGHSRQCCDHLSSPTRHQHLQHQARGAHSTLHNSCKDSCVLTTDPVYEEIDHSRSCRTAHTAATLAPSTSRRRRQRHRGHTECQGSSDDDDHDRGGLSEQTLRDFDAAQLYQDMRRLRSTCGAGTCCDAAAAALLAGNCRTASIDTDVMAAATASTSQASETASTRVLPAPTAAAVVAREAFRSRTSLRQGPSRRSQRRGADEHSRAGQCTGRRC